MPNEAIVDLRSLEPPGPLLHILEMVDAPGDGPYTFLLAREPLPLYPLLGAAGWRHLARRDAAGVILTIARRNPKHPA